MQALLPSPPPRRIGLTQAGCRLAVVAWLCTATLPIILSPALAADPNLAVPARPSAPAQSAPTRSKADLGAPAPLPPRAAVKSRAALLDELFARLHSAADGEEASGLVRAIQALWLQSGSDTADVLMDRALRAIDAHDTDLCLALLDKVVVVAPDWAEVWNKRATIRFYAGDFAGSMADIAHVLALEPRHFGALMGMGTIFQKTNHPKEALTVYRRALALNPQQDDLRKVIDELVIEVEGQGI